LLENGTLIEGYRIDRLIGEGGMGTVYEATQLSLDRHVALKLLSTDLSVDSGFRERFRHEARIQGALDHPNIVTVHEAGESDYGLFIAMELIRGATLKDLIVGRELDAGRTFRILAQVAEALDSAHDAGLIHRDIKPHNILVRAGRRDHAYLADFGVTKVRGGTNLTKTGHFVGTVDYMAPEQIRGEPATRETDIYALGTVLFECLSGAVPFPKDSDVAVMYAHLADPPPRLTEDRPELPPELDAVISTAMAKNPQERYSSAVKMLEAFEQALGEQAKAAVAIPPPIESPQEMGLRGGDLSEEAVAPRQPDTSPSSTRADETRAAPIQQVSETEIAAPPPMEPPAPAEEAEPAEAGLGAPAATVGSRTVAAPGTPPAAPTSPGAQVDAPAPVPAPVPASAPVPAPAAPARAPERGLPTALIAGIAALVILGLAAGGYLVGHSGGGKAKAAPEDGAKVRAGRASVTYPSDWKKLAKAPKIPSFALAAPVALAPADDSNSVLALGTTDLSYPYLRAEDVLGPAYTKTSSASSEVVKLGDLDAFRTSGIRRGKMLYMFFTIPQLGNRPTTGAVCISKTGVTRPLDDCQRVVSGISVSGAKPVDIVPSANYASSVSSALKTLDRSRTTGLKQLRAAKTSSGQAKAARSISRAYTSARTGVRQAPAPDYSKQANTKIVAALGSATSAYQSLAAAAAAKSSKRYASAKKAIQKAEDALESRVADLTPLGYRLS
jgi:serine/threonine protein kinase